MAQTVFRKVISTSKNFLFLKSCDTSLLKIRHKSSRILDTIVAWEKKHMYCPIYDDSSNIAIMSPDHEIYIYQKPNGIVWYGMVHYSFSFCFFLPTYLCAFPFKLFFCSLHVWSNLLCPSAIYLQKPQKGSLKLQQ